MQGLGVLVRWCAPKCDHGRVGSGSLRGSCSGRVRGLPDSSVYGRRQPRAGNVTDQREGHRAAEGCL